MEGLLVQELDAAGAESVKETRAGVSFAGPLELGYRVCLWARIANRVLLPLSSFQAGSSEALYEGVRAIPWQDHLCSRNTLAVDCSLSSSNINHSGYAALVVKDAIVDYLRDRSGERPSVSTRQPDLRINCHLHNDLATVSIDLSGDSLHRRAYRTRGGEASLKENVAAAVLLRARWPEIASEGGAFVDPMCGAATLPIEAALMAADIAPGLYRSYFGFIRWRGHQPEIWKRLIGEAGERRAEGIGRLPPIAGYDRDVEVLHFARANVEHASLARFIRLEQRDMTDVLPPVGSAKSGLLAVNPPYGERMGNRAQLPSLYRNLGGALKAHFPGWRIAIITGDTELAKSTGLLADRVHTLYNGPIKCCLAHFTIRLVSQIGPKPAEDTTGLESDRTVVERQPRELGAGPQMLANRLRKNLDRLGRWAAKEGITCYRLYDADLPEYAVSIDLFEHTWVHIQEYVAPPDIDPVQAQKHLEEILDVIPGVLGVSSDNIFLKQKRRQRGLSQYEKMDSRGIIREIREADLKFLVNFSDYIDVGLFLDNRITRRLIRELAGGKRFLNLYSYTGTATVYADKGGARSTISVDSSNTYLAWAEKNLEMNGIQIASNALVRMDCLRWLRRDRQKYGLVFLDPPTFSHSKGAKQNFELQRDHVALIRLVTEHLEPDGILLFSNNYRKFKLDTQALSDLRIEDLSTATLPLDFKRNPRIHHCWKIMRIGR